MKRTLQQTKARRRHRCAVTGLPVRQDNSHRDDLLDRVHEAIASIDSCTVQHA